MIDKHEHEEDEGLLIVSQGMLNRWAEQLAALIKKGGEEE